MDKHYHGSKIQPFDVIDDWDLDFYLGNVVKYIQRHKHKGQFDTDIKKAIVYLTTYYEKNKTKKFKNGNSSRNKEA